MAAMSDEMRLAIKIVATDTTKQAFGQMNQSLNGLKNTALAVAGAVTSALAFRDVIDTVARTSGEINLLTDNFGMGAEEASKLNFALKVVGSSADEFTTSVAFLNKKMIDSIPLVQDGTDDFTKWGIQIMKAPGQLKATGDILGELRDKMQAAGSAQAAMGISADLLGKSSRNLAEFLQLTNTEMLDLAKDTEEMGQVFTDASVRDMRGFVREMTKMRLGLDGIKLAIGQFMLPLLRQLMTALRQDAGIVKAFGEALRYPFGIVKELGAAIGKFLGTMTEDFGKALAQLGEDLKTTLLKVLGDIGTKLDEFGPLGTLAKAALIAIGAVEVLNALGGVVSAVGKIAAAILRLPARTILLVDVVLVGVAVDEIKKTLDELTSKWETWRQAAHTGLLENQGAVGTFVKGLVLLGDDFSTFGTTTRGIFDQIGTKVREVFDALEPIVQPVLDTLGILASGMLTAWNGLFAAIGSGLGAIFSSFFALVRELTADIPLVGGIFGAVEWIYQRIADALGALGRLKDLFGGAPPGASGGGGSFSSPPAVPDPAIPNVGGFVGRLNGIPVTAESAAAILRFGGSIMPFAHGGIATRPTLATVAERGPEAIIPLDRMGGGVTFEAGAIVIGAVDSRARAREVAEEVASQLMRRMRGTGQLSGSPTSIGGFW